MTDHGISIGNPGAYKIFYAQIIFITAFALFAGKRGFCHYFCPITVIMIIGRKIRNSIRWPALHLSAETNRCTDCERCTRNCLMSLDVNRMIKTGNTEHTECILCGVCVANCPEKVIRYSLLG